VATRKLLTPTFVRRSRETSLTLEALGAEHGLTRQRIQQIAKAGNRFPVRFFAASVPLGMEHVINASASKEP
jgi:hypothetical protein